MALKASNDDGTMCSPEDASHFQSLIGVLHYLTFTRPDIAFSISKLSQFLHRPIGPILVHLIAAKHILHYLFGSPSTGILFHCSSTNIFKLRAFLDFD